MQIFGETFPKSSVSLARYARLIGYTEWAFFGISHPSNDNFSCREIWNQSQRDEIARYLEEAQDTIEQVIHFPLSPKWFEDERAEFKNPVIAKYGEILEAGVKKETVLSDNVAVSLGLDDCTITITPVQEFPKSEIHVFYPDTEQEIIVKNISFSQVASFGTDMTLTITIPRPRLVSYDKLDNPPEGLIWDDDTNFQGLVDVHRIYTDTSIQAKLVYQGNDNCTSFCAEHMDTACEYIEDREIGEIAIRKDSFSTCDFSRRRYTHVLLNYKAGLVKPPRLAESTIMRLAHSMMPTEPCGCDITQRLWRRDRTIPQILTQERIECPFGLSDGAWVAWRWALGLELVRASTNIGRYHVIR